jgi:RNA 3'-terminal phosphate cyclase (ATP)
MLIIDGSHGEGGGQIVRSSVALAAVTGQPLTIENIRAGRDKPGLRRQHLTAVQAAAEICRARLDGAQIGASRLEFRPQQVVGGEYRFAIGTAGSATLVLQTVLPALLTADLPTSLVLEGGTHNPWAPTFDFLVKSYLPLVQRMGPRVDATLQRPGFYPAGGGRFTVQITPTARLEGFDLRERGELLEWHVRAVVANLPRHIAERECQAIQGKSGWPDECFLIDEVADAAGPGNVVSIELVSQNVTEVFTGFGQKGVRAERVASNVWRAADEYLQAGVPVGPHLADQLLLPLGISAHSGGGGSFRTLALSRHSTTHIDVLGKFLDVDVRVQRQGQHDFLVEVRPK